jgi:hypothetical protein
MKAAHRSLDLETLAHLQLGLIREIFEQLANLDSLLLALVDQQPRDDLQP